MDVPAVVALGRRARGAGQGGARLGRTRRVGVDGLREHVGRGQGCPTRLAVDERVGGHAGLLGVARGDEEGHAHRERLERCQPEVGPATRLEVEVERGHDRPHVGAVAGEVDVGREALAGDEGLHLRTHLAVADDDEGGGAQAAQRGEGAQREHRVLDRAQARTHPDRQQTVRQAERGAGRSAAAGREAVHVDAQPAHDGPRRARAEGGTRVVAEEVAQGDDQIHAW